MGIKGKTLAEFFSHDFEKGFFRLYDSEGNETYYEDSCGNTRGVSREVVEMTMEEVEKLAGKRVKIVNKENN